MKIETALGVFFILCTSFSCVSKPGRPDAPLCTVDSNHGECTDARGDFILDHSNLLCTSIEGYGTLENHIDKLELYIRKLERGCKSR